VKARHLVWIRRICQAFFLCLFIYLLVGTRLPQDVYMDYSQSFDGSRDIGINGPVTFFFQMDPLAWLSSVISAREWIVGFGWAILVMVATILLGRFFCAFVCPFGTLHHMAGSIRPSLKGRALIAANRSGNSRRVKYFLFIGFMAAACVGVNYAGFMDPISFLFRSLGLSILPAMGIGLNGFVETLAMSDIKLFNYLGYGLEALAYPVFGYENKAFQTGWLIGFLFLVILFLNRIRPRFWCRVLCPLGALLGICARFSILTLEKDETKCTHCGACVRACQGAAAPEPGEQWKNSECLLCFNCTTNCPEDALAFRFKWPGPKGAKTDIGRRAVMGGLLVGMALPLLGRLDGKLSKTVAPALIRPPGSLPEAEFLDRCQRCGLCMKVCPTNVINPAFAEAGLAGFWTPTLVMTMGYCEYTCTLCTSVCPTGAIQTLTVKDKIETPVRIGSAYIDRGRCLPWNGNSACIVCEEHCPTSPKAIYFKNDVITHPDGRKIKVQLPFVDLKRCIGCGICEFKCPVKGKPAIRTISAGESRSLENRILL
jgi:ferredoxin